MAKEKGVGMRSRIRNILGVQGCVGALGWGLGRVQGGQLFTQTYTNQTS